MRMCSASKRCRVGAAYQCVCAVLQRDVGLELPINAYVQRFNRDVRLELPINAYVQRFNRYVRLELPIAGLNSQDYAHETIRAI